MGCHRTELVVGMKSFHCTECGRLFSRKRNLPVHVDSVHKGKKPFECEKCGKFFTQKSNLKSHLKAVHEIPESFLKQAERSASIAFIVLGKKPYACEVCCKTFTQKSNLRSHLKAVHAGRLSSAKFSPSLFFPPPNVASLCLSLLVTPRGSLEKASSAALTRTQPTASKPPLIALKQGVVGQRLSLVDKRGQALQEDTQKARTL
ncbi:unnamed protein product [Taenia asiatica]|uniref:Zinc finger protein n=1 Tax=Taenia asiatica TaxID=60517 RepID=A0A0R3W375_TAEAS|nr:unnamed protein product [Taenia asiatica]